MPVFFAPACSVGACSSEAKTPLERPYVEAGSAADVWDYTGYGVRLKVRVVEYPDGLAVPGRAGVTTHETLEVLASEFAGQQAYSEFGVAVGSTVLEIAPAMHGAIWRRVAYQPGAIDDGMSIRYGFHSGPGAPSLHEASENDTGLVYQRDQARRYRKQ
jgi:hypothetical protein